MSERPNIILIFSDSHRYDCTGLGGCPHPVTPNLDRLGREGAWFTHAFTSTPICSPARQSLLSGQWPVAHQSLTNFDNGELRNCLDPAAVTYVNLLRQAGWATHHLGKWGVHASLGPQSFGFDTQTTDADYHRWRQQEGLPPWRTTGSLGTAIDPVSEENSWLHWMADRALDHIAAHARDGRPFHLRVDFCQPHPPHIVPEPWASLITPASVAPWGSFAETFENKPWVHRQMLHHWAIENWGWREWAPLVARYLGAIAQMDHQIGRIRQALEQTGQLENTLLVYTTDHGAMTGGHRMNDKHCVMYEDVMHVPLCVHWPAQGVHGQRDQFVSNILDLPPTFMQAAGLPRPESFQGRSLYPLLEPGATAPDDWPTAAFGSHHGSQFGLYTARMVREKRYKYIFNATAIDELYDLEADPHELRNLAPDPAHAPTLARLRQTLLDWGEQVGDTFLTNRFIRQSLAEGRILDQA